ncbi:MAG: bleomycin resistance protein [Sulfobacillus acidophilus]|uniref:Bleomycin resistance protein n=1 Tax=Sulfobacillus acidophilus TaxID=53633 RepID=A0A2T2WD72_9FIRM|nr:MAG: bleomycin resistance protein [Sulfobacillus acidophilus]
MAVQLNHTIVASHDKEMSAQFLAQILGLGDPKPFAHFMTVELSNGVSLDFDDAREIKPQHYAFLVSDEEFDPILARVKEQSITYYADPGHRLAGQINTRDNGRGFYFHDPNGHNLEILTRPYGSGAR